jgi:tetratricopeptide (TPR) repeat protein
MLRKACISFIWILFASGYMLAQNTKDAKTERYLDVTGVVVQGNDPLRAIVNLYEGTAKIKTVQTDEKGNFVLRLDINKQYTIEVTKDGLISKRISFDTKMPDTETGGWANSFSMGLFKPCSGVDYSILKDPVDRICFDEKRRAFLSDKDYFNSRKSKMDALMNKNDQCMLDTYESKVKEADQLASQKNYQKAVETYRQALEIYPTEEYPAKQIATLNAQINKQQNSADAYKKAMADGDALASQEKYAEAVQKYKAAAALNPGDAAAQQKIADLQSKVNQQQAAIKSQQDTEERFNQAMAKASVAYTHNDFATAKQYYQEALNVKPNEALPQNRVKEIETILAKKSADDAARAADAQKKAAFENDYKNALATADEQFKAKKYDEARASYTKAISMKPSESYPAQRIRTIDNAVAAEQASQQKSKDNSYNDAIASANSAMAKGQYAQAKESLQKALSVKPADPYVQGKMAELDQLEQVATKQKALDDQFRTLIQAADGYYDAKDMSKARESYTQALALKPGDKYTQTRITAIDNTIAAQQAAEQKKASDNYNAAISAANTALAANQFPQAKEAFQKALTFKPNDAFAQSKLAEIDKLADNYAKQKALDDQYKSVVRTADGYYAAKDMAKARDSYSQALNLKPGDTYAQSRISAIDNALAADQVTKLKAADEGYKAAIGAANAAIAGNQFAQAKVAYQKALTFKPNDAYAQSKLAEVDKLADNYAKQKAIDDQYKSVIQNADGLYSAKDMTKAREAYNQALSLKPGDSYAQSRISAIDNAIAADQAAKLKAAEDGYKAAIGAANTAITQKSYEQAQGFLQKALSYKPGDNYATGKMAEVNTLLDQQRKKTEQDKLIAKQYSDAINEGDRSFGTKDYAAARTAYSKALQIKPGDSYASQKISALNDIAAAELAAKQKLTEDAYKAAMDKGTGALTQKDYNTAKEAFQQALTLKPADASATQKLNQTDILIKQELDRVAAEKAKKARYDDLIKTADQFFTQKNYAGAKNSYNQASALLPAETYPEQKLADIAKIEADQEKQLADQKAKDNNYNLAMANADKLYKAKNYLQARDEYSRASSIKPDETLPKTKVAELEDLIRQQQKEQDEAKARADAYTAAITAGNAAFNNKDYPTARISYTEALKNKPGDLLSADQIKKIDYILAEAEKVKKAEADKKATYDAVIASGDKFYDAGSYNQAKEQYQRALDIIPGSAYPKQRIARIDEINKALASTKTTGQSATPTTHKAAAAPLSDLNFKNESERQRYLDELKKKYPAGITLEKYKEQYREIYRYIIIRDNQAQEFRQITYTTYNGSQYSVNGKPITQQYFLSQVKQRAGETFTETDMQ